MTAGSLVGTTRHLVAADKGLLAMDESTHTCNLRFAAAGIAQTEERRAAYRELLVTTPGLSESISGAILYDETIRQHLGSGLPFAEALLGAGIVPGIKVDTGETDLAAHPGESVTEGLDGLRARLAEYKAMGAAFAKWRAVVSIGPGRPSRGCLETNADALARYAAACQEAGLVPVVEPEVLMDGDHTLAACAEVTETFLRAVFAHLAEQRVELEAMILKPNMVLPGHDSSEHPSLDEVVEATLHCLLRVVPPAVPGVAFLSGGQAATAASARLDGMNRRFPEGGPWALSFSFARAIQQPALEAWAGDDANRKAAQEIVYHRARCNRLARRGEYDLAVERR